MIVRFSPPTVTISSSPTFFRSMSDFSAKGTARRRTPTPSSMRQLPGQLGVQDLLGPLEPNSSIASRSSISAPITSCSK